MTEAISTKEELFVRESAGEMDIGGYVIPSVNAPIIMLDDIRDSMLKDNPPFAVIYWDQPEGRNFVVFSKPGDKRVDLSEVVKPYRGAGEKDIAAFKSPPQKEMAGEFIPLALEFPPDDIEVLLLLINSEGDKIMRNVQHEADGKFVYDENFEYKAVAWAYMPELPDSINGVHH